MYTIMTLYQTHNRILYDITDAKVSHIGRQRQVCAVSLGGWRSILATEPIGTTHRTPIGVSYVIEQNDRQMCQIFPVINETFVPQTTNSNKKNLIAFERKESHLNSARHQT